MAASTRSADCVVRADVDAYPIGVVRGLFARVSTGGDCLRVRDLPTLAAPVIGCFRDDVLLWVGGPPEANESREWTAVRTPEGAPGYSVAEYLVR